MRLECGLSELKGISNLLGNPGVKLQKSGCGACKLLPFCWQWAGGGFYFFTRMYEWWLVIL